MTVTDLAKSHRLRRQSLAAAVEAEAHEMWRRLNPDRLDQWSSSAARLFFALSAAQYAAARDADNYVSAALEEQDTPRSPDGSVIPAALAGIASDGRPLGSLLLNPVFATKSAISQGATLDRAMATGRANLDLIIRSQVTDAGRVADGVAIATRPKTGYVRTLVGKTCSRCAVLAGKFYRYNSGFQRHPGCDCTHIPSTSGDLATNPKTYFDSRSAKEQAEVFTNAGAQAIRDGADMNQVVNARRGMNPAGTTTEGTTRRGLANRPGRARLMPERIYQLASDREEAVALLRRNGFIF